MKTTRLMIDGMKCSNCERHVETTLRAIAGVHDVQTDRTYNAALVEHDEDADVRAMVTAVKAEGYATRVAD
jgi:copper chaperone CopZ